MPLPLVSVSCNCEVRPGRVVTGVPPKPSNEIVWESPFESKRYSVAAAGEASITATAIVLAFINRILLIAGPWSRFVMQTGAVNAGRHAR